MGIEKTHGRNYDLARLLSAIDNGDIVLPEFQRNFVWDTTAVEQLIATCLTGWPIGSLLLLPGKSRIFFKVREFDSAPPAKGAFQLVVLDGQQRLTSLYQALYGKGPFRYAVEFGLLSPGQSIEDLEDAIISYPADRWARSYGSPEAEFEAGVIPLSVLRQASDFYAWRDAALKSSTPEKRQELTDLYVSSLSGLDRYEVPAVVIDDDVHPEAVARIFERVNRLGEPLGTFDLVVAKSFTDNFNLRDQWEQVANEFPQLAEFLKGDGLAVLTVIALQVRNSVRQNDVLQLTGASVRDYWWRAAKALNEAVVYLSSEFAVLRTDWLPYKAQLTVLGGLALNNALLNNRRNVNQWFWSSVFHGRYDVASNTRAVEDYAILVEGKPVEFGEIVLDPETYFAVNRRQYGALHRGLVCLLACNDPLDPFGDHEPLSVARELSDEPVTVSFLTDDDRETREGLHLLTLGLLLSRRRTSGRQGRVSLTGLAPAILHSQLLPIDAAERSIEGIFLRRLELIAARLTELAFTGVRIASAADEQRAD